MRVAFITFEYPPFLIGGAGVYAYNLTRELVKFGHEIVIFTPALDSPRTNEVGGPQIIEVKVNRRLPLVSVQFWMNLPEAMKKAHSENHFDIVHVNGTSYWFIPGKIIDVPHVVTIHHLSKDANGDGLARVPIRFKLVGESNLFYQYLEKRCVKFANRIVAVSRFTKKRIIETYDTSVDRVDVIYNGQTPLPTEIGNDEIIEFKRRFNLDSRPIILFVGRVDDSRKGLDILLEAFSIVSNEVKSQLLVVGKGDEEAVLKKARDLGINTNIAITGFLKTNDLACSYAICDVYVCPSLMEGFGLTLLEAMAFNKKIIASSVGAIPEISNSSVTLIVPNNPSILADSIVSIIKNISINEVVFNNQFQILSWSMSGKMTDKSYKAILYGEEMN